MQSNLIKSSFKWLNISNCLIAFLFFFACEVRDNKHVYGLLKNVNSDIDFELGNDIYCYIKDFLSEQKGVSILGYEEILTLKKSAGMKNMDKIDSELNREIMLQNRIDRIYSLNMSQIKGIYFISVKVLNNNLEIIGMMNFTAKSKEKLIDRLSNELDDRGLEINEMKFSVENRKGERKNIRKGGDTRTFEDIEFVYIPAGKFKMGAQSTEAGFNLDEIPIHRVVITKGFWIGKYEVTQEQWQALMGSNPSHFKNDKNLPVEMVSWFDVDDFIGKLNGKGKGIFRLPTEAEWEYACRCGTSTMYFFGDDRIELRNYAWFGDSNGATHPVGLKKPNPWGLYDMYGNVWEWCSDWYDERYYLVSAVIDPKGPSSGTQRAKKGGCWRQYSNLCRSASRFPRPPTYTSPYMGFRLVREE